MRVHPNPASNDAKLGLLLPKDEEVVAFLSDLRGQFVKQVFPLSNLLAGQHLFNLDMSDLPPGMYLLTAQTGQEKHSIRVVKQ